MRPTIPKHHDLFVPAVEHQLALELAEVDAVISAHHEWVRLVHVDLTKARGVDGRTGRKGMSAAQVLRLGFLKHRLRRTARELEHDLADSLSLRGFLGLGLADESPKRSTIQENLALVRPETWGKLLEGFARSAEAQEHEKGDKARVDATVVETNVHAPSDSSLLWDCIRVLTRLMTVASEVFEVAFTDLSKTAKRLHHGIFYARTQAQREPAYREFVEVAERVNAQVDVVLSGLRGLMPRIDERVDTLIAKLADYRGIFARVIDQTRRRVLLGEKVPSLEKVFSIFERHTDIVVNGNRPAMYGHKVTFTVGASGFTLDCIIERGNPGDVTLAVRQIARQKALLGKAPKSVALDGAYASNENLEKAKALGVERCAFSKGRGLTPEEMAGSRRTYRRLRDFRAGIEAIVSFLKRAFGLDRCTWKGWAHFRSYVWSAVFSANMTLLARARIAAARARPCAA